MTQTISHFQATPLINSCICLPSPTHRHQTSAPTTTCSGVITYRPHTILRLTTPTDPNTTNSPRSTTSLQSLLKCNKQGNRISLWLITVSIRSLYGRLEPTHRLQHMHINSKAIRVMTHQINLLTTLMLTRHPKDTQLSRTITSRE